MGLLAEPRRKQKLSADPRNLQWKNDGNKFGQKMMEKMGWKEGHGLGRKEQGDVANIKLAANYTQKGLGALNSYDSTWISHHDDFADILAQLNAKKNRKEGESETEEEKSARESMELRSKCTKARIHYQKFTRMKDVSRYTDDDMAAVLGVRKKAKKEKTKEESLVQKKEEKEECVEEQVLHTVSAISTTDYFAAKMAAIKNRGLVEKFEQAKENSEERKEEEEEARKERKRRRKEEKRRRREEEQRANEELKEEEERDQVEEREPKKKKKKSKEDP